MNNCCGLMGWIFGHKFRARYDEPQTGSPPSVEVVQTVTERSLVTQIEENLNALANAHCWTSTIYVQDVCVRCGAVQERKGTVKLNAPPTSFAEQFYKERKQKWENAKEYAAGDPLRVACVKCFHVFNKRDAADKIAVCPACSHVFDVVPFVGEPGPGPFADLLKKAEDVADEAKQDDMPEEHKNDGKVVKTCSVCSHTWRVHPVEAFQGCPVCRNRK